MYLFCKLKIQSALTKLIIARIRVTIQSTMPIMAFAKKLDPV